MYEYDLSGVSDEPNESNHAAVAVHPPEVVILDEHAGTSGEKPKNTGDPSIADIGIDKKEIDESLHECDLSGEFDEPNENNIAVAANQPGVDVLEEKPETSDENEKLTNFEMEEVATSFKMEEVATFLDKAAGYYSDDSDVVEVSAYYLDYE